MKPDTIIIHHSLTKDSETVSWGAIRKYHKLKGWDDIGYHFGIENLRGQTEILIGRIPNKKGAHCKGYNRNSIGICVVGNFDEETPSLNQWDKLVSLIVFLKSIYPIKKILGHRELNNNKTCPGKRFNMDALRACVENK